MMKTSELKTRFESVLHDANILGDGMFEVDLNSRRSGVGSCWVEFDEATQEVVFPNYPRTDSSSHAYQEWDDNGVAAVTAWTLDLICDAKWVAHEIGLSLDGWVFVIGENAYNDEDIAEMREYLGEADRERAVETVVRLVKNPEFDLGWFYAPDNTSWEDEHLKAIIDYREVLKRLTKAEKRRLMSFIAHLHVSIFLNNSTELPSSVDEAIAAYKPLIETNLPSVWYTKGRPSSISIYTIHCKKKATYRLSSKQFLELFSR